jgi:hypothetical protein
MLRAVETASKGRKAKRVSKPEKAAAESTPRKIRDEHFMSDSGQAAGYAEAKIMGTDDPVLTGHLGDQLCNSLWTPEGMSSEDFVAQIAAALRALNGIAPRDEMEGMLAVQMIATHHAAMECFRRAMLPSQPLESRDSNLKHAEKLTRIYREQMEALQRGRQKRQSEPSSPQADVESKGQKSLKKAA